MIRDRSKDNGCVRPTLIAYELDEPFAALMSSSAKHSATDLTLRNADSRVCRPCAQHLRTGKNSVNDTYTGREQRNRLVDAAQRRHIDGLATDGTLRTDTRRVLTGTGVDDGVDEDLDGVLVREEVDDLERVRDDADGEELLAVVAALHHQAARGLGHAGQWEEVGGGRTCRRDARQRASAPS